ncbi:MAG: hypothetical protein ACK5IJ_01090 [Mangrovibacterium sp.]
MTIICKMTKNAKALISASRVSCSKISPHAILQAWNNIAWQSET